MHLIQHNIKKLEEIKNLLRQLPAGLCTTPKEVLTGSTLGQHFRHVLEFYVCLEKGALTGAVSYDDRERNLLLETDMVYAANRIEQLIRFLGSLQGDFPLILKADYSASAGEPTFIPTSLYRELAYALDHAVHHLAIVRIALAEEKDLAPLDPNLGVAPSTIRHRKECAQ